MRQYQAMGELEWIAMRKQQAIEYIKADYARFAGLCLKRFICFWAGPPQVTEPAWLGPAKDSLFLASSVLMFWGLGPRAAPARPGAWLILWLVLLYPGGLLLSCTPSCVTGIPLNRKYDSVCIIC